MSTEKTQISNVEHQVPFFPIQVKDVEIISMKQQERVKFNGMLCLWMKHREIHVIKSNFSNNI